MARQSAAWGVNKVAARRSDRFLAGLADYKQVTFVSHIQPDPDGLGSMVGLAHMVETCLGKPTRLTRDGQVCRAENLAMIDLLDIDLTVVDDVTWHQGDAVVMVDSQPSTGRHTFSKNVPIYAVIDHHQTPGQLANIPFIDIRADVGATCSMVTRYLMEQDIPIPERVATCLYYGIETELNAYPREADALDDHALQFLYPLTDKDVLAKIRNTPLPQSLLRVHLAGPAEQLPVRPAHHQLGERTDAAGVHGPGGRFSGPARRRRLGGVCGDPRRQDAAIGADEFFTSPGRRDSAAGGDQDGRPGRRPRSSGRRLHSPGQHRPQRHRTGAGRISPAVCSRPLASKIVAASVWFHAGRFCITCSRPLAA